MDQSLGRRRRSLPISPSNWGQFSVSLSRAGSAHWLPNPSISNRRNDPPTVSSWTRAWGGDAGASPFHHQTGANSPCRLAELVRLTGCPIPPSVTAVTIRSQFPDGPELGEATQEPPHFTIKLGPILRVA